MIPTEIAALARAIAAEDGRDIFGDADIDAAYRLHAALKKQGFNITKQEAENG